jgi:phosphate transport system permease protein
LAASGWLAAMVLVALAAWLLGDVLVRGWHVVSWEFLTAEPRDFDRAGGIGPIIVSTALLLAICVAVTVPLGLGTAVWLAEFTSAGDPFALLVRRGLQILSGVPSIVFGLFGYVLFGHWLGLGYSLLAGGLTLACMALPLFAHAAEEGLRGVPAAQRMAAAALGFSRLSTLGRIVLPQATPGIAAALALSIGRALAETAALLFTSGMGSRLPESLLDSGRALSVHIYSLAMNTPGGDERAYGAALVLVILVVAINAAGQSLLRRMLPPREELP